MGESDAAIQEHVPVGVGVLAIVGCIAGGFADELHGPPEFHFVRQ